MKAYQITADIDVNKVKEYTDGVEVIYAPCKSKEEIIKNCKDADILITIYAEIDKEVIENLKNLKYICVGSIGYNAVNIEYTKSKGIQVSNNPTYCIEEVADHTLALMLSSIKKLNQFDHNIKKEGEWNYNKFGNTLRRISELTVALVGFGNIARQVNKRLKGFGCKVVTYDPYIDPKIAKENGVEIVNLEFIQNNADIISIHTPLVESTKNLFSKNFISRLKKKPIIINCSRGEIIDEEYLMYALENNIISGAGLDVLISEYPDSKYLKSLDHPNLILTPHSAFYSMEAIEECDSNVGKFITAFAKGNLDAIPLL